MAESSTLSTTLHHSRFSKRTLIKSILSRADGGASLAGETVVIAGWVRTGREQGKGSFVFLEVTDGSCAANLQVIVDASVYDLGKLIHTGTSIHVTGTLKTPPEGTEQKIELRVDKVLSSGYCDPATYPLPKTRLTPEFLRDRLHLRARTNLVISSII